MSAISADRIEVANERYLTAMHGVQAGVAFEMSVPERAIATSPKHLRVGINSAMVSDLALAELLIAKGVFSKEEYHEAIADAAERELASYEAKYPGIKFR